jgi:hypothetical protein
VPGTWSVISARALMDVGLRFSGRRPASSWSSLSEFHRNGLPQEHPLRRPDVGAEGRA